jgi:aminopeptidase N
MMKIKNLITLAFFLSFFCQSTLAVRIDSLDITHYNLAINLQNIDSKQISGKAEITGAVNFLNTKVITLDLLKLIPDSIFCNKQASFFTKTDSTISISLDKEYQIGDSIKLEIYYHGSPVKDSRWGGFYFSGNYAFNMGVGMGSNPPNFGRCWYPCNDNFTDRATYEFHVTTDSGFMAVCSGLQEPAKLNPDGSIVWNWRLGQTIPTYIANVAVSKYVLVNSFYAGIAREIPIVLAVAAADTAKAKLSFFRLNQAMQCFEERFGPYLFDRVGYVGVPFNSGAMEHACNISYPLYAVDGSANYEALMAHELSHHWWGNLVTTRTAGDMWLNEGWASYCEALFLECVYGRNEYDAKINSELFESLRWAHVRDGGFMAVSGVPLAQTYGTHVYTKGGLMVHTLRNMMGDSAFFVACKNYMNVLKFRDVNSFNLMDYFTGYNKNLDLVDFFNTWIYDAGDHDFQVISFIEQGVAGKFVLQAQQQRRHKVNLIKKAELNLKIYYQNGSSLVVPVALVSDWSGMAKAEVSLSTEQNKNIAFVVLNEDNKLALAKTYQREWIKTTGIKNLNNALFTCTVSEVKDSALIYVEHHFASPFAWVKDMPAGIRISNERYWSVQGLWKEGDIKATAFLNYDGSTPGTKNGGFLDNELIKGLEDSLVLLYRPNPNEPFIIETDLTFQPGGSKSDKVGRFWINKLKKGDYAIGYKDITASNKSLISNEYVLKLFPNPTNDVINIELPQNHGNAKISIFNTNGVLIDTIAVKKNEQVVSYQTKDLTKGNYLLLYEEGKSKLNKTFIVY